MKTRDVAVAGFEVSDLPTLDTITVYFQDFELGKGRITVECYGCSWTSYFGAMGNKTIRDFVAAAGVDYLVNKLGNASILKQRKRDSDYLSRILAALKSALSARMGKKCVYNPHIVACSSLPDFKMIETDTGKEFYCCSEHIDSYRDFNNRCGREAYVIIPITTD